MANLREIREALEDTGATLARLERGLGDRPLSRSVSISVNSLRKRYRELEREFAVAARTAGLDICAYRIFPTGDEAPTVSSLASALADFQTLVSVVYDALKIGGRKATAHLSTESMAETSFRFAYSFPGSVGIALTLPNEEFMFPEIVSRLDDTIKIIFGMVQARDSATLKAHAQRIGVAPVRALSKWAKDHLSGNAGADIEWRRETQVRAKLFVQPRELEELFIALSASSEEEITTLQVTAQLVGADAPRKWFHLINESQRLDIRGYYEDAIGPETTSALFKWYTATIRRTKTLSYATEEEVVSTFLLRLEPIAHDGTMTTEAP